MVKWRQVKEKVIGLAEEVRYQRASWVRIIINKIKISFMRSSKYRYNMVGLVLGVRRGGMRWGGGVKVCLGW